MFLCLFCFVSFQLILIGRGKSRSKQDLRQCPMSSANGETPVVDCGVILFANRILESRFWGDDPFDPLLHGWYSAVVTCVIPF